MNPLFQKQNIFQRSYSMKLNPQQQSRQSFKYAQSLYLNQLNNKSKVAHLGHTSALINDKSMKTYRRQLLSSNLSNVGITNYKYQMKNPTLISDNLNSKVSPKTTQNLSQRNQTQQKQWQRKVKQLQLRTQNLEKQLYEAKTQLQASKTYAKNVENCNRNRIRQLQLQIFQLKQNNTKMTLENKQLLSNEKQLQWKLHIQASKPSVNQTQNIQSQKFMQVGRQFQFKINELYDQNYKLKNTLNLTKSKLEQSQTLTKSLKIMNQAFEKRNVFNQSQGNLQKQELRTQNKNLREENLTLNQEKDRLISEHELEILSYENKIIEVSQEQQTCIHIGPKSALKLQNQVQELQNAIYQQINQILRLKQKNSRLAKIVSLESV